MAEFALGRSILVAERELPWLDDRCRGPRPPRLAASIRPGRDIGGRRVACGMEDPLSDRPWCLLRCTSSSRRWGLRKG